MTKTFRGCFFITCVHALVIPGRTILFRIEKIRLSINMVAFLEDVMISTLITVDIVFQR